jgi:predicted TPR repeat methyltransferase
MGAYGHRQIECAIRFAPNRGFALDVGCGAGRCVGWLTSHGFCAEGIDASARMISVAKSRHPMVTFTQADICRWNPARDYDLIVAWDSVWHVPLDQQEPVLYKLCAALAHHGVLIFSTGGLDCPSEKSDQCMGPQMYYSVLGIPKTLAVLANANCICRHLEYDQFPEKHVFIVAQKT